MPHPLLVLALSTPLSPSTFSSKQHAYLDQDQLFQYQPLTGQFSVLQLIRGARLRGGACPAVNTLPLQSGTLPPFRTHVYLGHERLLELNPASGEFRVLCFNRTKPCAQPANTTVPAYDVVQRGVRPDLRAVRHDAPPALVRLVHEMLSPAPEDRPASAEGVAWELRALIAKQRSRSAATTEPPAGAEARAAGAPLRVLLVEDDEDMARVLAFYTQQILGRDVELRRARDGVEAIDAVRAEAPDLLLLDLHMPRMNGIEVCMELRGARLAPHARIVSVSAGAQEHDLQLLHALGMHHFVPKGQDLRGRLEAALRELFPLHVSRAAEGSRE